MNVNPCDVEPIHLINDLQDFGLLVILSKENMNVIAVGENCEEYLGQPASSVFHQHIDIYFPELQHHFENLNEKLAKVKNNVLSISFLREQNYYFVNIREVDNFILLEIEIEPNRESIPIFRELNNYMAAMIAEKELNSIFSISVDTIQNLADFDRVVLYRFKNDYSGEVVSEAKKDGIESLLGYHFPANDIPLPARKMFENNPIRVVNRIVSRQLKLLRIQKFQNYAFNLGGAGLRAPHTNHIEYLTNMGIDTSISISLVCEGKLWGLFICHNVKEKVPSPSIKNSLALYANIVSIQIDLLIRNQITNSTLELETILLRLIGRLNDDSLGEIPDIFTQESVNICKSMDADGFLYRWNGIIYRYGDIPKEELVDRILSYIDKESPNTIFSTDHLVSIPDFASEEFFVFPGIVSVPISFEGGNLFLWFRKEMQKTIHWRGNPDEKFLNAGRQVSPRKSFENYIQAVKGKSQPWSHPKLQALENFLGIREIIEKKMIREDLAKTLQKVKDSEDELRSLNITKDKFFSIISHNLRSPFSGLLGMSDLLISAVSKKENFSFEEIEEYARYIRTSSLQAFELVKNLFEWGRIQTGKASIQMSVFSINNLLDEICYNLSTRFNEKKINFKLDQSKIIEIKSDYTLLSSVITHVLTNAIKYSNVGKDILCKIFLEGEHCILEISDFGIGISPADQEKLFKIESKFLNPGTKGETGTGLGLIISKEHLRMLGGDLAIDSNKGVGTTVRIKLPLSV